MSIYDGLNCTVTGCPNPIKTKFLCNRHYKQTITYGKILTRTCVDKNEIVVEGDIAKVFLYNRKREKIYEVIIDASQKENIEKYMWKYNISKDKKYVYAISNAVGYLHKYLMDVKQNDSRLVDHKNRNTLDNRMENLRICTRQENSMNSIMRKNNKSGHKGIWWCKEFKKWGASYKLGDKNVFLGRFDDKEDAIKKYNEEINKVHGKFSVLKS